MKRIVPALMVLTIACLHTQPSLSQTSEAINDLLKKSKLVDTGRKVNSTVGKDQVTISTFCHPAATDRDIKITALLMMKELRQHYKNILRINVNFFDPGRIDTYRKVEIREGDVVLVDMGKPLTSILSEISVTKGKVPTKRSPNVIVSRSSVSRQSAGRHYSSNEDGIYRSADGDVEIQYPQSWKIASNPVGPSLLMANRGLTQIALFRMPSQLSTPESLAAKHEAGLRRDHANYKRKSFTTRNCNGVAGHMLVGKADFLGVEVVERAMFISSHKYCYWLTMVSPATDDAELDRVFEMMLSSLRVGG